MKTGSFGATYQTPTLATLEIKSEGVLCESGEKWYEKEGQGDFNYGVETDNTWA